MAVREASHAGSWYSSNGKQLSSQLDAWLDAAPNTSYPGARAVISPHAGFSYSGPCAAWAYKALDLSRAKRIFILHPSHHFHLRSAALPTVTGYETPLSDEPLPLDLDTINLLSGIKTTDATGRPFKFEKMSQETDEAEHSAEMQLPYIHRLLQKLYPDQSSTASYPPLVPIMIGNTSPATEKALGAILAPFIADKSNAFVISSDFCHWGSRFSYTYYLPDAPSPAVSPLTLPNGPNRSSTTPAASNARGVDDVHTLPTLGQGQDLRSASRVSRPAIHESIAHADRACMCAVATGQHDEFLRVLGETGNTVCGRHPIGTFMAGVEEVEKTLRGQGQEQDETDPLARRFRFLRYERSSDAVSTRDSSVSYVSAVAVL